MDAIVGVFVLVAFFALIYQFLKRFWIREQPPIQQATCKIVAKREEKFSLGIGNTVTRFLVTFEKLHWGHQFEIQVWEKKHYKSLQVGDEGVVFYQGTGLVRFEKTEMSLNEMTE